MPAEPATRQSLDDFNHLYKEMQDIYARTLKRAGISDSIFWTLYTLTFYKDSFNQKRLCETIFLPKQTVNSALKKMQTEELITLAPLDGNRKSKEIHLTAVGQQAAAQVAQPVIEAELKALEHLSPSEQESFIYLLGKFCAALDSELEQLFR